MATTVQSVVGEVYGGGGAGFSVSLPNPVASGNSVVITLQTSSGVSVTSITDNLGSTAYPSVADWQGQLAVDMKWARFRARSTILTGPQSFVIRLSAADLFTYQVQEISGPIAYRDLAAMHVIVSTNTYTLNFNTAGANEFAAGLAIYSDATTTTAPNWTVAYAVTPPAFQNLLTRHIASAGANSLVATLNTNRLATVAVALFSTGTGGRTGSTAAALAAVSSAGSSSRLELRGTVVGALGTLTTVSAGRINLQALGGGALAPLTASASGALSIRGAGAPVLGPATLASTSLGMPGNFGALAATLAPMSGTGSAVLRIDGAAVTAMAPVTTSTAGRIDIAGLGGGALAPLSLLGAGALGVRGLAAAALEALQLSSAAELQVQGSGELDATLEPVVGRGASSLSVRGVAEGALAPLATTSTGVIDLEALGGGAFAPLSLSADATLQLGGEAQVLLDELSSEATLVRLDPIGGRAAVTLADATLVAAGKVPSEVWDYVLGNGKTAGQNLVEVNEAVMELLQRSFLDETVQGDFNAREVLRVLVAVAAGRTVIQPQGRGKAIVTFRSLDDTADTVVGTMNGSTRVGVQINA